MPHYNKQMISFFLTTKCNLRCKYCYNSKERNQRQEQSLSLEKAKVGLRSFFETNSSRHLRFYGPGEPTQEFQLLKDIVEYAKSLDESITTEVQTNGCFSDEECEWLSDNMNIIWISFDGEPDIQNIQRPLSLGKPSSPVIEKNVKMIVERKSKAMVGARVTMTNLNLHRQKEMLDYFHSLGIRYVWSDPLFPSVGEIPVCNDLEKSKNYHFNMDKYVDEFVVAYHYAKELGMFYGSFLICNFDGICNKHCRACTPVPHLTTDGYISACDLVTFGENAGHMDCFVYGKWNEESRTYDYDYSKITKLQNRTTENMLHCSTCEVKEHCGGYCLGEVMNETGSLLGQKPTTCKAIKKLAKEIGFIKEQYKFLHP